MSITAVQKALKQYADREKAKVLQGFFKTGKGQYGEGDVFLGVQVPIVRKVAQRFIHLSLKELKTLIKSPIHEERLLALIILVLQYEKENTLGRENIFKFYLASTRYINNWDLVDLTCIKIVGNFLFSGERDVLYSLARSSHLWERRIAIVSTHYFIKKDEFSDTLKIAKILIEDTHDLIHKAVGWMLREVGKRNIQVEEQFLKKYYKKMPRTMLRYAIEKFPEIQRQAYLKGRV